MFHTYVASVLSGYCICLNGFQVFLQVFQKHVSSVSSVFFCILQVFHLDVLKVDRTSVAVLNLVSVDLIFDCVSHLHGG
jgi:hypothetical protein